MIYYHGTRTPIHLTDKPYLDTTLSGVHGRDGQMIYRKDPVDPDKPHVYVTNIRQTALLFALPTKTKHLAGGHFDDKAHVIYHEKPLFEGLGHLYTLTTEDIPSPLEQRDGAKFACYKNIPLFGRQHSTLDLNTILGSFRQARLFYLDKKTDPGNFSIKYRFDKGHFNRDFDKFIYAMKADGLLHELHNPTSQIKNDRAIARPLNF